MGNHGSLEYNDANENWGQAMRETYADDIDKGSTIEMILDIAKQTMKFNINEQDLGIAYDNFDTSKVYHMVICVQCFYDDKDIGEYIEMINFDVSFS